jgi:hypothetical protein
VFLGAYVVKSGVGFAKNPGPVGLGLLVYLVKARAQARIAGSDVMNKKIFSQKIGETIGLFDSKQCKILSQHRVLRKTPIFRKKIVENRRIL